MLQGAVIDEAIVMQRIVGRHGNECRRQAGQIPGEQRDGVGVAALRRAARAEEGGEVIFHLGRVRQGPWQLRS